MGGNDARTLLYETYAQEVDAVKRRNLVLFKILEQVERERADLLARIEDGNLCKDCARLKHCKGHSPTYSKKLACPECFCSMWEFGGTYTLITDISKCVREASEGRCGG